MADKYNIIESNPFIEFDGEESPLVQNLQEYDPVGAEIAAIQEAEDTLLALYQVKKKK